MGLTPACSTHNAADLLLTDTELLGQLSLENSACVPASADLPDLGGGEPVHPVGFSTVIGLPEAALGDGISDILAPGSEPPMAVVLTWPEVTSVANLEFAADWSYSQLVSPPMSGDHPVGPVRAIGSVPEEAVPLQFGMARELSARSGPGPAVIRSAYVNFVPVADLYGQAFTRAPSLTGAFTHNAMIYHEDLAKRGLSLDDYDDDVISV